MTQPTKEKILTAALSLFLKRGFEGTSISQIAKEAKINQSLIYHHYESKEDLWSHVKKHCIDLVKRDLNAIRYDSLEIFLTDLIDIRFNVYQARHLRLMAHWQALESDPTKFYRQNMKPHPLFDINDHILKLQQKGLVRRDQEAHLLSSIIFSLTSYAFFDYAEVFYLSHDQSIAYKKMALDLLKQALQPARTV